MRQRRSSLIERLLFLVCLVEFAIVRVAAAAPPPSVVLLELETPSPRSEETQTRARAELVAAGFRVIVKRREHGDTRTSLEQAMRESGSVAAIAINAQTGSSVAEVWVSDRLTGKLSIRPVETGGAQDTPSLLAIRSVELLRASLIELENPSKDVPVVETPPEIAAFTRRREVEATTSAREGFGIEVKAVGIITTDPITPAFAPGIGVTYVSAPGFGARVSWTGPSVGGGIDGALGKARLLQGLAIAEALFVPPLDAPIYVTFNTGIGLYYVSASGDLADPELAKSEDAAALAFSFGAGFGFPITEAFSLGVEAFGAITVPRVAIDMGAENVGSVGQPVLGVALGAAFGL
jgi:hypothetical protein